VSCVRFAQLGKGILLDRQSVVPARTASLGRAAGVERTRECLRESFPPFAELQHFRLVVLLGILVESGLFWWGEMAFARREDPGKNQKHGQGGRGRGRVVPILSHVSQSSQESQVTVKHRAEPYWSVVVKHVLLLIQSHGHACRPSFVNIYY
jgi:hypothetical protein